MWWAASSWPAAIRSTRAVGELLEGAALARCRARPRGDALVGVVAARADGRSPRAARQSAPCIASAALLRVAQALDLGPVALLRFEHGLAELLLDADERIVSSSAVSEPGDGLAAARACLGRRSRESAPGPSRRRPNAAASCSAIVSALSSSVPLELLVELPEAGLELAAHVVDVGGGLLAVEDAGADLDRLADGVGRGLVQPAALADETRGALVVDREARRSRCRSPSARTVPSASIAELKLWLLRGFHSGLTKVVAPSDGNLTTASSAPSTIPRLFPTNQELIEQVAVDVSEVSKLDVEPGTLPETMAAWVIRPSAKASPRTPSRSRRSRSRSPRRSR